MLRSYFSPSIVTATSALADSRPPHHLHEEAQEIGWSEEEILEAVGHLALNEFQSLIASAAALPKDQATPRVLPEAA